MGKHKRNRVLLITLLVTFFYSSLFAVSSNEMGIIINLAGKQRMLSQKMAKEVLLIARGIDVEANRKNLFNSSKLFDKTLKGLIKGDKSLGLVRVKSKSISSELKSVQLKWIEFYKQIQAVIGGNSSSKILKSIASLNIPLLKNMHKVVNMYEKESSKLSNIKSTLAKDINYAGRQRMLTQKMTKEILLVALGIDDLKNAEKVDKTKKLFEKSLNGLINGDKELGLKGVKLFNVKKQLLKVEKMWKKTAPTISVDIVSDDKKLRVLNKRLLIILKEMNEAVKMYEQSVKKQKSLLSLTSFINKAMEIENKKSHVVSLSGKQEMLTQKMAKEAIFIALGFKREENKKSILESAKAYDTTLKGLLDGNKELGLGATTNKKVRVAIKETQKKWEEFYSHIKIMANSETLNRESFFYIISKNEKMLKQSHKIVMMYKRDNTMGGGLSKSAANALDIADRQRMLSQKMIKEKLLILGGINTKMYIAKLRGSILLFDHALNGLLKGDKKRGLIRMDDIKAREKLKKVLLQWNKIRLILMKQDTSDKELQTIVKFNLPILIELNSIVELIETSTNL